MPPMTLAPPFLALQKIFIEKKLDEITQNSSSPYAEIYEAARYSLLAPAKRVRPLLTLATVEAFQAPLAHALTPACAIELIHTYSLIHDDLPCMDDDDLRRGRPTLHKVFPEGQAVLAGDLLLTLAFETASKSPYLTDGQKVEIIQILAEQSGGQAMVGGQSLDLSSEGKSLSWQELQQIHYGKTAALLTAALEVGAIVAHLPTESRQILSQIGKKVGLAFQIVDDILDIEGRPELTGKPALSDAESNKTTSVSLLGLKGAKELAESLLASATSHCKSLHIESSELAQMLPNLVRREA